MEVPFFPAFFFRSFIIEFHYLDEIATDLFFIYALFYCLDWKMEPVLIEE